MKRVDVEKTAIVRALDQAPSITIAAKQLGTSRRTLQARMRDYSIPPGEPGRPRDLLPRDTAGTQGDTMYAGLAFLALGGLALVWWKSKESVGLDHKSRCLRGLDVVLK